MYFDTPGPLLLSVATVSLATYFSAAGVAQPRSHLAVGPLAARTGMTMQLGRGLGPYRSGSQRRDFGGRLGTTNRSATWPFEAVS